MLSTLFNVLLHIFYLTNLEKTHDRLSATFPPFMDLRETLDSGHILLLDGAMGTKLADYGLQGDVTANRTNAVQVGMIHAKYIHAGSECITTNTFLLNELTPDVERARKAGKCIDLDDQIRAGVAIARNVARDHRFVLGGIGPTGRLFEPDGPMTDATCRAAYLAQARSLTASGEVDGLIIETMTSLREALIALEACFEATGRPVIVSMAFRTPKGGGRTLMGDRAMECAEKLAGRGAEAVGTNCGEVLISEMARIVAAMRKAVKVPIVAQPNLGSPHDEATIYDMTPKEFADGVKLCIDAGATVVGGCCGAGPECIGEVNERIKHL